MKIRYFGVLNDASLAPAGILDRDAVIVIESIAHARGILQLAYHYGAPGGGWAKNLDGNYPGDTPGMGDNITLTLWALPFVTEHPAEQWNLNYGEHGIVTDPYPDYVLSIGPRGGIVKERAW